MRKARSGAPTTSGFVGFNAFAAATAPVVAEESSPSYASPRASDAAAEIVYQGDDADLKAAMRKLGKRDAVTKLKALAELLTLIPTRDKDVLRAFVPAWCYAYLTLALANDRRVRAGAHNVLTALVRRVRARVE